MAGSGRWESTKLSYLGQVGIDPFRERPLLHRLLLICKSEPRASLSVTCNDTQSAEGGGIKNTQSSHCVLFLRVDWLCRKRVATLMNFDIVNFLLNVSERPNHTFTPKKMFDI